MSLSLVIYLLALHFAADFVAQSDQMALNKSSSNYWLTVHVGIYAFILGLWTLSPLYGLVNGALHWMTDYFTSRWTARLWKAERRHDFFVAIGFDQLVHTVTLLVTATLIPIL